MESDRKLIGRYLAGDLSAFESLFDRHERQVYSFAFHMTDDRAEADDLCQDIWLQVLRSLASFEGRAPFRGWIHGVATNVCRRRSRKKSVTSIPLEEERAVQRTDANPQSTAAAAEARVLVQAALSRLPEEQREVVILHELQEFSYAEIGRILGCPNGTVKSRLHYAMEALRRLLGAQPRSGR